MPPAPNRAMTSYGPKRVFLASPISCRNSLADIDWVAHSLARTHEPYPSARSRLTPQRLPIHLACLSPSLGSDRLRGQADPLPRLHCLRITRQPFLRGPGSAARVHRVSIPYQMRGQWGRLRAGFGGQASAAWAIWAWKFATLARQ